MESRPSSRRRVQNSKSGFPNSVFMQRRRILDGHPSEARRRAQSAIFPIHGEARTYLQEKRVGALESGHRVARHYRLAAGRSTEGGGTLGSLRLNHRRRHTIPRCSSAASIGQRCGFVSNAMSSSANASRLMLRSVMEIFRIQEVAQNRGVHMGIKLGKNWQEMA